MGIITSMKSTKSWRPTIVITKDCDECIQLAHYANDQLGAELRVRPMCRKFKNITKRNLGRVMPPVVLFGDTIVNVGHSSQRMSSIIGRIQGRWRV
jgi:hypothetical protein